MSVVTEDSDAIMKGDSLFGILNRVSAVGAFVCLFLIGMLP
jgi:hypothetical protein